MCIVMKQILLLLLLCAPAFGRLGETKDECEKRYGKPVTIDGKIVKYVKNDFVVAIQFVDDKACFLMFTHTDPEKIIGETERDEILKANAGNRQIVNVTNANDAVYNSLPPDSLHYTQKNDKRLIITDAISWKKIKDQKETDEKQGVKGF